MSLAPATCVWIECDGAGSFTPQTAFDEHPDAIVTSLDQLPEALRRLAPT